jgi:hypothetical protein
VEPDRGAAQHDDQGQADPQHQVDLLAAQLEDERLGQRREHDDDGGQQHRCLLGADDAALHEEAEMLGRECCRRFGVALGALEGDEEEDQREKVEQ